MQIIVSPRKSAQFLLLVVLLLTTVGVAGQVAMYFLGDDLLWLDKLAGLFKVSGERNIPTLYSFLTLLLCSFLLAGITLGKKKNGSRYVVHWGVLSIIFLFLSLDELLAFHEKLVLPLRSMLSANGFFYSAWVIPGAGFVLVVLLIYARFFAHLPPKIRQLFLVAGAIYVGGTIGMEMVGGNYAQLYSVRHVGGHFVGLNSEYALGYALLTSVEEFLEMLGIIIFVYALLFYISLQFREMHIYITNNEALILELTPSPTSQANHQYNCSTTQRR